MNSWIKTIFFLSSKLGKLEKILKGSMEDLSKNMTLDTYTLCNKMLAIEDKLRRVCNFRVIGKMLEAHLSKDELTLIKRHIIAKETFADMAYEAGLNKSTLTRRFAKAIDSCITFCENLTFTLDRMQKDYKDIPLIIETLKMFTRGGTSGSR